MRERGRWKIMSLCNKKLTNNMQPTSHICTYTCGRWYFEFPTMQRMDGRTELTQKTKIQKPGRGSSRIGLDSPQIVAFQPLPSMMGLNITEGTT